MSTTTKNWVTIRRGEVFTQMSTVPEEWEYLGGYKINHSHCQLCQTEIVYQFPLTNRLDHRVLLVGSECIVKHYEAWMPDGLERILDKLEKAMTMAKAESVALKLEEFKKEHSAIVDYLNDPASKGKRGRGGRGVYVYVTVTDEAGAVKNVRYSTSRYRASLKRKGYLTAEEVVEIMSVVVRWTVDLPALETA